MKIDKFCLLRSKNCSALEIGYNSISMLKSIGLNIERDYGRSMIEQSVAATGIEFTSPRPLAWLMIQLTIMGYLVEAINYDALCYMRWILYIQRSDNFIKLRYSICYIIKHRA